MTRVLFCVLALMLPMFAFAELTPPKGSFDARVRVVDYNAAEVVKLTTFFGVSTHVQFGPKEAIKDVSIGDELAWTILPRSNHLFIKPKAQKADTNVTVITDQRVYHFALVVSQQKLSDSNAWSDPSLVFSLSFRYPEDEANRVSADARLADARNKLSDVRTRLKSAKAVDANRDYWVAGSEDISPTAARDDGRFIYLTFTNNRDMPVVYAVDQDGTESLVNTNVEGNEIVVQRLVRKLTLRKGNAVACVVNKSFDVSGGNDNASGTVAPDVERVIKGVQ